MSSLFEEFILTPGAFLKGSHPSLSLKDVLDVYSPSVYELHGGGRLPEQRPRSLGAASGLNASGDNANGTVHFNPGKVNEQAMAILSRGDVVEDLRAYLESAKQKMQGKFKNSLQSILILAARQSRVQCVCLLLDEYHADVNGVSTQKKHSPLHFAAYNGNKELARELLLRGADKTLQNKYDETPEKTAANQVVNDGVNDLKRAKYEECRDLIASFTLEDEVGAPGNRPSGLDTISTYVPTSQQTNAVVDTLQTLRRSSQAILNKVTDDTEIKMFKRLQDLVPVSGFNQPSRHDKKFEIKHFQVIVENLWKTAIAQQSMAGLFADLADKLHTYFAGCVKGIVNALPTTSGKFYRMVFDQKLPAPLYDSDRTAIAEAAKCVNFKRELLMQCQQQFESERDLSRFRREIDWDAITDKIEVLRKQNDVMYARNKAQDRMTANVVFIGQLYNHNLASTSIIKMCVESLLPADRIIPLSVRESDDKEAATDFVSGAENDVTMLVKLIEVIGQKFEKPAPSFIASGASQAAIQAHAKAKRDADRRRKLLNKWFKAMKKITSPVKSGADGEFTLQNRVRFGVQDLVELRQRGWVTRGLAETKSKKPTADDDGWTSVGGNATAVASSGSKSPSAQPSKKKTSKSKQKAEKARKAALARAAEEAARRKEVNKEAQRLADDLRSLDQDAERLRIQISKHMNGAKQAKARRKKNQVLKKLKQERNKIKAALKVARLKGPDPEEPEEKKTTAPAVPAEIIMPDEDDYFELPPLKNEAKVKGMLKEFLEVTVDFAEFSRSLQEMELADDEGTAAVVFYLLMYACESLSSSTKRKHLLNVIALLEHLLKNNDVSDAQFALSVKAMDSIIEDLKMDAPLAGKVYDEVLESLGKKK